MTGKIFNIQRFCIHDGPGIRTTVFLKGCPLKCAWCHNPESQKRRSEIFYMQEKCILCGACASVCPLKLHRICDTGHIYDRTGCTGCGACAKVCSAGALELTGEDKEASDIIKIVMRDADFYTEGGGGLTLSGGEPMAQPDFALELARLAKCAGISVCIETCGFCAREDLERILPYVDNFLYDLKIADRDLHKRFTGVDNSRILENLDFLNDSGARIVLRCPIIPEVNFCDEHFNKLAELALSHPGIYQIDLEPYHPLGIDKSLRLGVLPAYDKKDMPDPVKMEEYRRLLQERTGVTVKM